MKKYIMLIFGICLVLFSLAACGNSTNSNSEYSTESVDTDEVQEENKDLQENDEDIQQGKEKDEASKWGEDELNLAIGETATAHNNFSKTEVTLDSVEIVNSDEYEEPYREQYVITYMTVKNIGEEPVSPEDVFGATDLVKEDTASGNMWGDVEGLSEGWPDEISIGEEASGPLVFDMEKSKGYTLEMNHHFSSLSNKISFVFDVEEAK